MQDFSCLQLRPRQNISDKAQDSISFKPNIQDIYRTTDRIYEEDATINLSILTTAIFNKET